MSRHRNIRSMNYTEEYDGYDDVYGHSVEDEYCISPSDAAFIYDREGSRGQQKISAFFKSDEDIAEEDETADRVANLDDIEKAKLNSCIEKVKSVLGDIKISEQELISLILKHNFEVEKVIDVILSSNRLIQETKQDPPKEKDLTASLFKNQKIHIPKLFGDVNKSDSTDSFFKTFSTNKKFEVPSLFADKSDIQINDTSSSHTSLSSLVSSHLRNKTDVPNLLASNSEHSTLSSLVSKHLHIETPKLFQKSEQQSNEMKDIFNNDWHIDLTSALCNSNTPIISLSKNRIVDNGEFITHFVHCETPTVNKQKAQTDFCKIDISDILLVNNVLEKNVSEFGKIITRHFRLHVPNIHIYEQNYENNFNFNTPSPDDFILKHLRRK